MKDGQEIVPQDDNISLSNEGYMSVLVIHEVSLDDAGVYECKVQNVHGTEKCRAEVIIGDVRAHFLSSFPEHTHLTEHKDLELECELSDEEAVIQWLKNGSGVLTLHFYNNFFQVFHSENQTRSKCSVPDPCDA